MLAAFMSLGNGCDKGCTGKNTASIEPVEKNKTPEENKFAAKEEGNKEMENIFKDMKPGEKLYAEFDTSMGTITAELFWEKAPNTVKNFVELATGKKEWIHPSTQEQMVNQPLYNGTKFHRVIKGFMIQGGDPTGTGMGGPGYRFKDEFNPELRHDKKGILSMANAGPNTNGSQFFITDAPTPHLNNRHSVFGQVSDPKSLEVISAIAGVETDPLDKPKTDVVLKSVKITKDSE